MFMHTVVFIRHAQSEWNLSNRFTGWTDVDLTAQGEQEAVEAGRLLAQGGFAFDEAHTSFLRRTQRTLDLVLATMRQNDIPVYRCWLLNERHYGALQGLDKAEILQRYGSEQFKRWRRGYRERPPALVEDDSRHPRFDPLYADISRGELPATESLEDTRRRVARYWEERLVPRLRDGRRMLVSTHGNTLRALIMHLDNLGESDVEGIEVPTGNPLIYTFSRDLRPMERNYLL
jgi:2,3-bisphosphoglycerate-dependent phosphoglycerate mutase